MRDNRFAILVADENPGCHQSFRETLEPEGYDVLSAGSGREAIRIIRRERIHVAVMDICLPDYSGLETYHAIKDILGAFLPCIFTALEMTPYSLQGAMNEDAITILPKPVDMPRLVHAVDWSIDRFYPGREGSAGLDPPRFRSP